jgi:TATA-box binding protein (TBP) (component of TFIID and TFIIIB)
MEITNFKFSMKILFTSRGDYNALMNHFKNQRNLLQTYKNFFVILIENIKYIIFCNGHINISGVRTINEIKYIQSLIPYIFDYLPRRMSNGKRYQIDNISATECFKDLIINLSHFGYLSKIDGIKSFLTSINHHIKPYKEIGISYEPELFHGIRICTNIGTCIMFATGKVNYLGSSSIDKLNWVASRIYILIKIYKKFKLEMNIGTEVLEENRIKILNTLFCYKNVI